MPGDSPLHIKKTETDMIIYGTALLAACHLLGIFIGDLHGQLLGVKTNVGGVGIAMLLLMAARLYMLQHNKLPKLTELGVEYWGAMYIPVVVSAVVIALINRAEVVSPESPDAAQLHNPLVAAGE